MGDAHAGAHVDPFAGVLVVVTAAALVMHGGNVTELLQQHAWLSGEGVAVALRDFVAAAHTGSNAATAHALSALEGPEGPTLLVILTALWAFSNLGVILLLLMVSLESSFETSGRWRAPKPN